MKTIQEKSSDFYANGTKKPDFVLGVEFAQRFISVEEELPTEPGKYLVIRDNEFEICEWKVTKKSDEGYWYDYMGITHWRPIEISEPYF